MKSSAWEVKNGAKRSRNKNVASCGQRVDENREILKQQWVKVTLVSCNYVFLLLEMNELNKHLEFAKFSECLEMKSEKREF